MAIVVSKYSIIEDLGNNQKKLTIYATPIAHLHLGNWRLNNPTWVDSGNPNRPHLVDDAPFNISVGDDGLRRIHPTKEENKYIEIGGPTIKVANKWTKLGLANSVRTANTLSWNLGQANITITHGGYFIKLSIELKNGYLPPVGQFAFPINLTGLTITGNTIYADGIPVMIFQTSYAIDLDNELDIRPIGSQFIKVGNQNYIQFTLPNLVGMSRPLIDPTITIQPDAAAGKDVQIKSITPTYTSGAKITGGIGLYASGDSARELLSFDTSLIPADATVTDAIFTITRNTNYGTNAYSYACYALKRAFVEGTGDGTIDTGDGANWNRYDGSNNWGTAGCDNTTSDRNATGEDAHTINYTDATFHWHIPTMAQDWITTPANNKGFILCTTGTWSAQGMLSFFSSDYTTATSRPKLEIIYTLPTKYGDAALTVGATLTSSLKLTYKVTSALTIGAVISCSNTLTYKKAATLSAGGTLYCSAWLQSNIETRGANLTVGAILTSTNKLTYKKSAVLSVEAILTVIGKRYYRSVSTLSVGAVLTISYTYKSRNTINFSTTATLSAYAQNSINSVSASATLTIGTMLVVGAAGSFFRGDSGLLSISTLTISSRTYNYRVITLQGEVTLTVTGYVGHKGTTTLQIHCYLAITPKVRHLQLYPDETSKSLLNQQLFFR